MKVVQSSITTLKWSEDSHYGVRIMVPKSPDPPFSSYGPHPFFGPAISAEKLRNSNFTQFTYVRCRFLSLLIPGIDCNCLFKEIIKGNDILKEKIDMIWRIFRSRDTLKSWPRHILILFQLLKMLYSVNIALYPCNFEPGIDSWRFRDFKWYRLTFIFQKCIKISKKSRYSRQ